MVEPRFRFAPSPNGLLHLGHAYSALVNEAMACAWGGAFRLRIEDIDTARSRPAFEAAIFEDLRWLGLAWAEPVRRQSEHFDDYRDALDTLGRMGLVKRSYATRKEIAAAARRADEGGALWPADPDGSPVFPGDEAVLDAATLAQRRRTDGPCTLRLDMVGAIARVGELAWQEVGREPGSTGETVAAEPLRWGDVVLARKDTPTSYHLSVVVDDAAEGVTHIVRGRDLFHATAVHRVLQILLGLPEPRYHHHRLILDEDGTKLSKSRESTALAALRQAGVSPAEIRARLGFGPLAESS